MSDTFHKNCHTSRRSGNKYGKFSTNPVERKQQDDKEAFDIKFKEFKQEITSRILAEVEETQKARESINCKFKKVDEKINSILELQNAVLGLRRGLQAAEASLSGILLKVDRLDVLTSNERLDLYSRKDSSPSRSLTLKEIELSTVSPI